MKRWTFAFLFVLTFPASRAAAQTPVVIGPNSLLAWDVAAPDVATANGFAYAAMVDAAPPKTLTPVTCAASATSGVQTCKTSITQIPLGSHAVSVTAASGTIVSLPSVTLSYLDLLIPVPSGVRFIP